MLVLTHSQPVTTVARKMSTFAIDVLKQPITNFRVEAALSEQ